MPKRAAAARLFDTETIVGPAPTTVRLFQAFQTFQAATAPDLDDDQREELVRRAWDGDEEAERILLAVFDRDNEVTTDEMGLTGVLLAG